MLAGLALAYADRHLLSARLTEWDFPDVFGNLQNLALPIAAGFIAWQRPANRIGWLALAAGLALAINRFSGAYALHALAAAPGSWPAWLAAWLAGWTWMLPTAAIVFFFLIFPTGRLRSRRWRPVAWLAGAAVAVAGLCAIDAATSSWARPLAARGLAPAGPVLAVMAVLVIAALAAGVVAAMVRFAYSEGDERLQLKWVAAAAVLVVLTLAASALTGSIAAAGLMNLSFLCVNVAAGIAVVKYRLYGIDIVISKAVLYRSLAAFITAVYAAVVFGIGALAGSRHSILLTALAAAVVAVAIQPTRQRAERLANRVVYGKRATPYQVLSQLARRLGGAYPHDDVLAQVARMISAGVGAQQVVVWLRASDELRPEAWSDGNPDAMRVTLDGEQMPAIPGADLSVPVRHHDNLLGAISIGMPRDEPLRPAAEQLVADIASQAGLVLSNVGLIEELRASRQRLVATQDEVRRQLERNIHDGAQQDLIAMIIKLRLAEPASADDPKQAQEIIRGLAADATRALENLRDLANGVYPPLLADLGLAAALNAQARRSPLPVLVETKAIPRYPQEAEAAIYFCCLEALQNATKHSGATVGRIVLQTTDTGLRFTVSDDGRGYDASHIPAGSGLRNMADRLAALGGTIEVRSAPGQGTTVTGCLPCHAQQTPQTPDRSPAPRQG